MANRMRRPDQQLETRLWMGSQPDRHHRRRKDLGRTRSPDPQPGQDQRPGQLTAPQGAPAPNPRYTPTAARTDRSDRGRLFQVEVTKLVLIIVAAGAGLTAGVAVDLDGAATATRSSSVCRHSSL